MSAKKSQIFFIGAIVVSVSLAAYFYKAHADSKNQSIGLPLPQGQIPSLRRLAVGSIELNKTVPFSQNLSTEVINKIEIPDELPKSCQVFDIIKKIVESDIDSLLTTKNSEEVEKCLIELGGPVSCLTTPPGSDEDRNCTNNFIIARARLIDSLSKKAPIATMDEKILANKIIAKIYSTDKTMDESGPEIFTLSDRLVELRSDDPEAHNLRSYFSIQSIKKNFDPMVLEKGKESAEFLSRTSDLKSFQTGLLTLAGYSVIEFISSNDLNKLVEAENYSKEYMDKFPTQPYGYYMMGIVYGYKDDIQSCKKWTQKGMEIGGTSQFAYPEYQKIVESIDAGTFVKTSLGIRVDPSDSFNPEKILQ